MYREACTKHGNKPGRMTSSYFIHFADTPEERAQALQRQIRYWRECGGTIHIGPRETAPKSYEYYYDFKAKMLQTMEPEEVTERAVLLGSAQQITDTLKKMEALGFNEVILYFSVGLKPHAQAKDEMARFMEEVAPDVSLVSSPSLRARRAKRSRNIRDAALDCFAFARNDDELFGRSLNPAHKSRGSCRSRR